MGMCGSSIYLLGVLLFTVAQVAEVAGADGGDWEALLVGWPYAYGGFCFFLGGLCELGLNKVFVSKPVTYVWWVSVMNAIGGVGFWISACPSVVAGDFALYVGAVGTATYLIAGVLSLMMWRGEQFGGSIIPVLNDVRRTGDGGGFTVRKDPRTGVCHILTSTIGALPDSGNDKKLQDVLNPKLSLRGLFFVQVFIVIGAAQIVSCCGCLVHKGEFASHPNRFTRFVNIFMDGFANVVIAHMTLVLNSASITVPTEQPYYSLAVLMRFLSFLILANSILTLRVLFETPGAKP